MNVHDGSTIKVTCITIAHPLPSLQTHAPGGTIQSRARRPAQEEQGATTTTATRPGTAAEDPAAAAVGALLALCAGAGQGDPACGDGERGGRGGYWALGGVDDAGQVKPKWDCVESAFGAVAGVFAFAVCCKNQRGMCGAGVFTFAICSNVAPSNHTIYIHNSLYYAVITSTTIGYDTLTLVVDKDVGPFAPLCVASHQNTT